MVAGCAAVKAPEIELGSTDLMLLYEAKDYFRLRDRLKGLPETGSQETLFFRAAVQHVFNQPTESNATIDFLLALGIPPDFILYEVRLLKLANHVRLHQYREAHKVAVLILGAPPDPTGKTDLQDVRNMARLFGALRDVLPQETTVRAKTILEMERGRIPVRIGEARRRFVFDTGANYSVLMRSEAEALGLAIREAGVEVGTSTDLKVQADVAVAERVSIGNIDYRNVVFLVFPDELLTFEGGFTIPGIIGFPLIEAMGEVRFRKGGMLEIPAAPSASTLQNLALDQLEPLVEVRYRGDSLVCRLDTGANKTVFYEPFFQKYRARIELLDNLKNVTTAGVGGARTIPAYRLPEAKLTLGETAVTLNGVDVYTQAITDEEENDLFCNIGLDLLGQFDEYVINFRMMSLLLK